MEFRDIVYESEFRSLYPELSMHFTNLDILGGRNCKACNKRKVKSVIKTIESSIKGNTALLPRLESFPNINLDTNPEVVKNYSTQISLDMYARSIPLNEIKEFLLINQPKEATKLYYSISTEGYYSSNITKLINKCYARYSQDHELKERFNKLLDETGRNKLFHDNPKCKIVEGQTAILLENKINEFLVGRRATSISFEGNRAVILYHLMK